MTTNRKISLLTLLGLILPFGNIWGPLLLRIPKNSPSHIFRRKLIIFELILTLGSFTAAIAFNLKGLNADFNPKYFTIGAFILLAQYIAIIATAIITYVKTPESIQKPEFYS